MSSAAGRRAVAAVDGPWERRARTRYLANIITGALSPTNFLPAPGELGSRQYLPLGRTPGTYVHE
jgi:hypothetical protein